MTVQNPRDTPGTQVPIPTVYIRTSKTNGRAQCKVRAHLSYSIVGAHLSYIQQALASTSHLFAVASRGTYSSERAQPEACAPV
jgi:hypothetical protein